MQLDVAGVRSTDADHAASHIGKATGMAAILRGTPRHAARCVSLLSTHSCQLQM